ncbi:MAG: hypothetical protein ACTSRP_14170 [Candidatus Helarchaeota archaeon]
MNRLNGYHGISAIYSDADRIPHGARIATIITIIPNIKLAQTIFFQFSVTDHLIFF